MIETRDACVQSAAQDAAFLLAFAYLIDNEGTRRSDDPRDQGGLTKFGITRRTLSDYLGRPATEADVDGLTQDDARGIYWVMFWQPLGLKDLAIAHPAIATVLFDSAVLCGQTRAVRMAQQICGQKPDGTLGPKTKGALSMQQDAPFVYRYCDVLVQHFVRLCEMEPVQLCFLRGWCHRALRHLSLLPLYNA